MASPSSLARSPACPRASASVAARDDATLFDAMAVAFATTSLARDVVRVANDARRASSSLFASTSPRARRARAHATVDDGARFVRLCEAAAGDGTRTRDDLVDIGGVESEEGVCGVVAKVHIPADTPIMTRALSSTAFDATYARSDDAFGANAAISAYEGEVQRLVSDDVPMALMLVFAKRYPERSALGAYALSLPKEAADTPALYEDESLEALVPMLSLHFVDQVDAARREFAMSCADARQIVAKMSDEPALEDLEFAWAWSMVRTRAITFAVKKSGTDVIERKRCLVPVCDVLNHSPTSTSDDSDDGPNVSIESNDVGESIWKTTRDVAKGQALRWTYGELSNEEMWLWYGFVPSTPSHGDCSVVFNLPDTVFANGLNAVAKEDREETAALRRRLLERCGALGLNEGEELSFVLTMRGNPKVLGGIAGLMCCDADEVVAVAASAVIASNGGGDGSLFSFKPETRRRAGRYVAWLLTQVEAFVCGATDAEIAELERTAEAVGGEFAARFRTAKRLRTGAKSTFAAVQGVLTEESLLKNGSWIDDATKTLIST